jgi:hypothetical protein
MARLDPVQSHSSRRAAIAFASQGGTRVPGFVSGGLLPAKMRGKTLRGMVHITDYCKPAKKAKRFVASSTHSRLVTHSSS